MAQQKAFVEGEVDPSMQVNPKWYEQFLKTQQDMVKSMATLVDKIPQSQAVEPAKPYQMDRSQLTTIEEAKKCTELVGKDFVKVDANRRPIEADIFYTPTHWFPMYQSSNQSEFIATFSVEQWKWVENPTGEQVKQVTGCEHVNYKQFVKKYRLSVISILDVEELQSLAVPQAK